MKIPVKHFERYDRKWREMMLTIFWEDLGSKSTSKMVDDTIVLLDGILFVYADLNLHVEGDQVVIKTIDKGIKSLSTSDEDTVKAKGNERKFMIVPPEARKQIKAKKGRKVPSKCYILKEDISDEKCPYGKGHKVYYLEHDVICINLGAKGFGWLSK